MKVTIEVYTDAALLDEAELHGLDLIFEEGLSRKLEEERERRRSIVETPAHKEPRTGF